MVFFVSLAGYVVDDLDLGPFAGLWISLPFLVQIP